MYALNTCPFVLFVKTTLNKTESRRSLNTILSICRINRHLSYIIVQDNFVFFLNKNIAFSSLSLEQRMNTFFFYLLSVRAHLVYEVAKDIFVWGRLVDLCPLSIDVGDTHVVEKSVVVVDRIKH